MIKQRKYHVTTPRAEKMVNEEPYYYSDKLIGESREYSGQDRNGKTYTRTEFVARITFPEILDLFDDMPVSEKLHLRNSAPGIEQALLCLGFTLGDLRCRIGDGELADYVLDVLRCKTRSQLFYADIGAYNLVKDRKHLKNTLLPTVRPGPKHRKKKGK